MPSLQILLLATIFSLTATTTASGCPKNRGRDSFGSDSKCCYGTMMVDGSDAYCCVPDSTTNGGDSLPLFSSGAPSMAMNNWSTANSCFAKIPFTASDYSSQVSSASAKAAATTTGPSTNEATSTSPASGTSTTNAAMPVATAEGIVLSGAAVAAALFVL